MLRWSSKHTPKLSTTTIAIKKILHSLPFITRNENIIPSKSKNSRVHFSLKIHMYLRSSLFHKSFERLKAIPTARNVPMSANIYKYRSETENAMVFAEHGTQKGYSFFRGKLVQRRRIGLTSVETFENWRREFRTVSERGSFATQEA